MEVFFTGEVDVESGGDAVIYGFNPNRRKYFGPRDYGEEVKSVCILLICRSVEVEQRIRFVKSTKSLYVDLMVSVSEFEKHDDAMRRHVVMRRIMPDLPGIIAKKLNSNNLTCCGSCTILVIFS